LKHRVGRRSFRIDDPTPEDFLMQVVVHVCAVAAALVFLTPEWTALAQSDTVFIDVAGNQGPMVLLMGTNAGPMAVGGKTDDYTALFKSLGVQAVRTHDYYGPCDWMTIFPNWAADPDNPDSYQFGSSDSMMARLVSAGFEVMFRLGSSWRGSNPLYVHDPPGTLRDAGGVVTREADTTDFKKFAAICVRIVMHYNEGWASGFRYNIKRWEIWNEPSVKDEFWSGTAVQFQRMFGIVSRALRAHDASLLIGGPGQAEFTTPGYFQGLLDYCRANSIPLDFYSWHSYGGATGSISPWELAKKALEARTQLDAHGYTATRQYCDEWNAGLNQTNFAATGKGAAFYAAVLTYFVQNGVSESYQYRADNHPLGLVQPNGGVKVAAEALRAWQALTAGTIRVPCTGTDTTGFTAIATRSMAGNTVRLLIANYPASDRSVTITLLNSGAGPNDVWTLVDRVIDDARRLALVDSITVSDKDIRPRTVTIAKQSVRLFDISRRSGVSETASASDRPLAMQVFPNPARIGTGYADILYSIPVQGQVRIVVRDILGREADAWLDRECAPGAHVIHRDISRLSAGSYRIELRTDTRRITVPLVIIK
jgi:xylan 1,4-beta-xylosidase